MKRKMLVTMMSLLLTVSLVTVNVSAAGPEGESSFAAAAGTEKIREASGPEEGTETGDAADEEIREGSDSDEKTGENCGPDEETPEGSGLGEAAGESVGAGEAVGESTGSDEGMGEVPGTDGEANEGSGEDESGGISDTEALEAAMSGLTFFAGSDIEVGTAMTVNTENSVVTLTFSGFPDDGWSCVFYDGSALSSTEISVEAGETIDLIGYSCSYPGYEFEGWYLTSDCSGEEITELTVNEDITVYAKLVSDESTPTALSSDGGSLSTGSYYLDGDVTLDADIEIDYGEEVTIDLNGYTLTGVESFYMFYVFGSLTLTDSSATEDQEGTGTITGTGSSDYFICVTVYEEGTFTMNGGTITGDPEDWFLGVLTAGTFIMNGGTIACNSESSNVGVEVGGNGSFTMNGGTISGNGEYESVGAEVIEGGTFTMNGGTISGHYSTYGGVYVESSTFVMNDGTITGNTAGYAGGGVCVVGSSWEDSTGTFTMTGGTITGNTAENAGGGGVYIEDGAFTMTGGTISDNMAAAYGGVYVYGTFNMSGSPVITGNTVSDGTDTQTMNVYLEWGQWITLIGALTEGASIGVTSAPILEGYSDAQITSVEDTETGYYIGASGYFTSDNADCRIEENGYGFLRLYVLSDITGTVTVSGDPIYGQTLTAVLDENVPTGAVLQWMRDGEVITGATGSTYILTADDVGKEITVAVTHADYLGSLTATAGTIQKATPAVTLSDVVTEKVYDSDPVSDPTVTVALVNGDTDYTWTINYYDSEGNALTGAPFAAGSYQVIVTVEADSDYYETASVNASFIITAAEQSISYSTASVTKTVGDSAFTNELTQTLVYGELTYESSDTSVATVDSNGIVTIVGVGTAVITATAPGSDSYTEAVASYTLTVNAAAGAEDSDDTDSSGDSDSSAETDSIVETDSSISEETFDDSSASVVSAAGAETGDDMNLTLWLTLLLAGAAALTAVFAVRRKG